MAMHKKLLERICYSKKNIGERVHQNFKFLCNFWNNCLVGQPTQPAHQTSEVSRACKVAHLPNKLVSLFCRILVWSCLLSNNRIKEKTSIEGAMHERVRSNWWWGCGERIMEWIMRWEEQKQKQKNVNLTEVVMISRGEWMVVEEDAKHQSGYSFQRSTKIRQRRASTNSDQRESGGPGNGARRFYSKFQHSFSQTARPPLLLTLKKESPSPYPLPFSMSCTFIPHSSSFLF